MEKEQNIYRLKNKSHRFQISLSWNEFQELFNKSANCVLAKRGESKNFSIDDKNSIALAQLWYYTTLNPEFQGDLNKGILLQGKYGCGKSLMMESYSYLQNHLIEKLDLKFRKMHYLNSQELLNRLKTDEFKDYLARPLTIDELGREPKRILDFGNSITPMINLLGARADTATITHGTTNFSYERLASPDYYGAMIGDRLKAMFNFIFLDGESRRT